MVATDPVQEILPRVKQVMGLNSEFTSFYFFTWWDNVLFLSIFLLNLIVWQTRSRIKMSSKTHFATVCHLRPSSVLNCWTNCINLHQVDTDTILFYIWRCFWFQDGKMCTKIFHNPIFCDTLWHFQNEKLEILIRF